MGLRIFFHDPCLRSSAPAEADPRPEKDQCKLSRVSTVSFRDFLFLMILHAVPKPQAPG